jgi:hypothetical protein
VARSDAAPSVDLESPEPTDATAIPLPDAAPDLAADRGPPGVALLVVGDTTLAKGDSQFLASLTKLGFSVVVKDGVATTSDDANGKALVVVSGSSWSADVGAKFRDVPIPVVVFDAAVFGPMKMTGTKAGTDFGTIDADRRVMIIDDTHPLAAGLTGLVTVANANLQLSWGVPGGAAIKIATVADQATRFTIFAYAEGATMVGMAAPARRVGAFVRFPDTVSYTDSGLMLFEAAALWAVGALD